jgi:hypothetical protein
MTKAMKPRPPGKMQASLPAQVALMAGAVVLSLLVAGAGPFGVILAVLLGVAPIALAAIVGLSMRVWMVVLITATCINGIRMPLGGFNLLPEHFLICGVLVVLVLRMPATILRPPSAFEALLLMWIGWNGVVSFLFAPEPQRSLPIVAWLLLSWVILWVVRGYLLHAASDDADYLRRALLVVGAGAGFLAFVLWILAFAGLSVPGVQPEPYTRTVAARGLSYEANILGSQELFIVVAALAYVRSGRRKVSPVTWAGLGVGILSSMTRAVWVAAIVVVGLEWMRRRHSESVADGADGAIGKRAWVLLLGLALLPFLFVSASNPIAARFRGSLDLSSGTAQLRLGGVKDALGDMKGTAVITGLGTNSFGQRHRNVLFADQRGYLSVLPLVVVYDTGIIGGALVVGACAAFLLKPRAAVDRRYARMFLIVLLITGSSTNPLWFGIAWVMFAIVGTPAPGTTPGPLPRIPAAMRSGLGPQHRRAK